MPGYKRTDGQFRAVISERVTEQTDVLLEHEPVVIPAGVSLVDSIAEMVDGALGEDNGN